MYRARSDSLALVALFVWLTACTSATQIGVGEVSDHGKMRVTTTDGEKHDFFHTVVEADSIKGQLRKQPASPYYDEPVYAISLDQVSKIERFPADAAKTVGLVLGIVFVVVVGSYALLASSDWD
jgi:hypothetical protein